MGAAIAAGSHAENGNCALLVQDASIIKIKINLGFIKIEKKDHEADIIIIAIETMIKASPTRLDKIVIDPDPPDFGFWYIITRIYDEIPKPSQPNSINTKLFLLINRIIDRTNIIIININCL